MIIAPKVLLPNGSRGPDLPEEAQAAFRLNPDGQTYTVTPATEEDAAAIRWHIAGPAERAVIRRREAEQAGITLTLPDGSTVEIPTGREDRAIMDGAVLMLQSQPERVIRWRAKDGTRIPVDADSLMAINAAVWEYIEECFEHEAWLVDNLEADPEEGWPSQERTFPV